MRGASKAALASLIIWLEVSVRTYFRGIANEWMLTTVIHEVRGKLSYLVVQLGIWFSPTKMPDQTHDPIFASSFGTCTHDQRTTKIPSCSTVYWLTSLYSEGLPQHCHWWSNSITQSFAYLAQSSIRIECPYKGRYKGTEKTMLGTPRPNLQLLFARYHQMDVNALQSFILYISQFTAVQVRFFDYLFFC